MSKSKLSIIIYLLGACSILAGGMAQAKSATESPEGDAAEQSMDSEQTDSVSAVVLDYPDAPLNGGEVSDVEGEPPEVYLREETVELVSGAFVHSLGFGAANGLKPHQKISVLPKNTRQSKEGYWIGSLPSAANADALFAHKIRLVITATRTKEDLTPLKKRFEELGIKHLMLPFGSKFPKPSRFMKIVSKYEPDRIFIHCDHGGDRSGALLAYLLIKNHDWKPEHALLSVLYPGQTDIRGLKQVLKERGYSASEADIERYLGIYSASGNGGGGGLKVRSDDYKKLINTLLDSIEN